MATGERIKFIRNLRGMTQKLLGMTIGFDEKSADVRMAQYESGTRTPKENLVNDIANALEVSPHALSVPNIDSYIDLMHTLFALEDLYGFKINKINDEVCITLDKSGGNTYLSLFEMFSSWQNECEKLKCDEITKDDYDAWRYNYPKLDKSKALLKAPSQGLNDLILGEFQDKFKNKD